MIKEISYYSNPIDCVAHFEKEGWISYAISLIKSWGTLIQYGLHKLSLSLNRVKMKTAYTDPDRKAMAQAQKLIVCIHGLNNAPTQFKTLIEQLEKTDLSGTAIYTPAVLDRGNAPLDELVKPILENIKLWAENGAQKELVLVGISNGGRVARAIEVELAKAGIANIQKIHFVSIVGACKGSSLVNLAHKLHLPFVLSKNIYEEMGTDSERFQRLNQEWEEYVNKDMSVEREYTFFASPHDWQVPNYESTLMEVNPNRTVRYAIVEGHGHNSIVNAIASNVSQAIAPVQEKKPFSRHLISAEV